MTDIQMLLSALGITGTVVGILFGRYVFVMDRRSKQADDNDKYIREELAGMVAKATEAITSNSTAIKDNEDRCHREIKEIAAQFGEIMKDARSHQLAELKQLKEFLFNGGSHA